MIDRLLKYSIEHKLIILLLTLAMSAFGFYSLSQLSIGAVPDVTNNQVQVITTSRSLATEDVEKFLTYPVELEMANLPGVKEIRSVSKFGLSVVTVVFEDDMGTYLPRQLIAEKLKTAEEKIPAGFGKPFMGPISTGLGEIYQYYIEVDPAYRNKYPLSEVRSIQDWIVKRQLSGIPGVVEVNTWGGYLKQYEVAIDPQKLRAMHLSITEIFSALEKNNSVSGGAYIEKAGQSYFVRGEGLIKQLKDIENIVVGQRDGLPIYMRDIGKVQFGHANRFGAITANGEGEKVLGQVMMLKGANSKKTIELVKQRVDEIAKTLPPGIRINGFLERSELIDKTTFTIAENLILGCLIVIFVVVLLLGNLRSGLVVASVIPLSLLFALSLMYLFGVDANLMSLGAIDFGIIIDGAVIIIEYIAFKINSNSAQIAALNKEAKQALTDKISLEGSVKMMHSAIFGQLIIIIVFIPILALTGVEGKMFRPMAMVFSFALIGAMILCFTYVPVMSSIFIKPQQKKKANISDKLIHWLQTRYKPSISWALDNPKKVLVTAFSLFGASLFLFNSMGGEFVPTLDEGDFVIQPVLKTGTSLEETVSITTEIEKILGEFPEVDQVVTRIGAAEVPTDPMSMEESDVIIKLKAPKYWSSAETKDELADAFKAALSERLAGMDFEFTQPIEMRFNELITGVRADLAIKVFGEDLDLLHQKAEEIEKLIENVPGAADIIVEKTVGLLQMSVHYDRAKIARYGLNIEDLNRVLETAFAGKSAGTIFEGERQFDLVLRFDENNRQSIEDLANSPIKMPDGRFLPLREFAKIEYTKGPAKISRDNTQRRIVVSVNVRGRDLESMVQEIQGIIDQNLNLPSGYRVTYGGQFENLRAATQRLSVAVPIALVLIFILLYFAFDSIYEALMIFSAIPMSAIGGVLLLYARGLPFSISAGVGFIALFGIAVLNGLVLIEEFKSLEKQSFSSLKELIIEGTQKRLRPVLLTASAAALGFLPMAISTSAGAEVQRPLATVVVGGLISATALTLIVLPILYAMMHEYRNKKLKLKANTATLALLLLSLSGFQAYSQKSLSLEEALEIGEANNALFRTAVLQQERAEALVSGAFNIDRTEIFYSYDENNIAPNDQALNVWGFRQRLEFPSIYGARYKNYKAQVAYQTAQLDLAKRRLHLEISRVYYQLVYAKKRLALALSLDSIYNDYAQLAQLRFEKGQSSKLEQLSAKAKQREIEILKDQRLKEEAAALLSFNALLQAEDDYTVQATTLIGEIPSAVRPSVEELLLSSEAKIRWKQAARQEAAQGFLPDLSIGLFQGNNQGANARPYSGIEAGIAIPLWFGSNKAQLKAARVEQAIAVAEKDAYANRLSTEVQKLELEAERLEAKLGYFNTEGLQLIEALKSQADVAFKNGAISFIEYSRYLEQALKLKEDHLQVKRDYTMVLLQLKYLN